MPSRRFRFIIPTTLLAPVLALLSVVVVQADTTTSANQEETCAAEKIRLGLEWFLNPDHLSLIVADKHGIFKDLGLDVELVVPSDHWEAEEEILAGRLDVAVTEPLHLAQDAAKGKPVLGFARFLHTDGGVMYNADKIHRPADMCGATISYPGSPGPGGPAIVHTMVQADNNNNNNGECSIDSYRKHNGGFFHTDALAKNEADVATLIFWNFEIPEARARGLNVGFFSLKDWGVPDFCQLVLMTTPERLEERKHTFRKLVLALRRATGVIHQQPEVAKEYYRQHVGLGADATQAEIDIQEATLNATLPAFPNDSMMSEEYYVRLMEWLVDTKQVDPEAASQVPVSEYWTNSIAW
jgi:putative hydroxymethylpyrimidine transport system substrate-binding protein